MCRHKGALQVDVVEAKGLPRMDTVGTSELPRFVWARIERTSVVLRNVPILTALRIPHACHS